MFIIFKVAILVALLKILNITGKPFLCSGIYAVFVFIFSLLLGEEMVNALINFAFALVLASLYFWLLDRFNIGWQYWIILFGGLFIGLV